MTAKTNFAKDLGTKKFVPTAPVSKTVEQSEQVTETPKASDGNKGKLAKLVKDTDMVTGMNIATRPTFDMTADGVLTVQGIDELFQIEDTSNGEQKEYAFGTWGRLFNQVQSMPYACYGSKCTPQTIEEIQSIFGLPVDMCESILRTIVDIQKSLNGVSPDELAKEVVKRIDFLKGLGYSESNIRSMFAFQKGRFDVVFRPTFSTRTFTKQRDAKNDLVVLVQFDNDSQKQAFLKEYPTLDSMLQAFATQKTQPNAHATFPIFMSAKTALHNGTAKVEVKERETIKVELSNEDLGIS